MRMLPRWLERLAYPSFTAGGGRRGLRADIFIQEFLHPAPEVDAVLRQRPAVAFLFVLDPLDVRVALFDGVVELGTVRQRHALVGAAVGQQQRLLDLGRPQQRRGGLQLFGVRDLVADQRRHAVLFPAVRQVGGEVPVAVVQQVDVGDADPVDAAPIQLGVVDQAHQRGVAAVAGAGDAHALGVGVTLGDSPARAVGDVVLHLQAPLLPAGAEMPRTEAGAAAVFRLQHSVAARGQELHLRIPAPGGAAHVRTAVHQHHHRQILAAALRQRQPGRDVEAVARLVMHQRLARHLLRLDFRVAGADHGQQLGLAVV
jgi:hypothetical protein